MPRKTLSVLALSLIVFIVPPKVYGEIEEVTLKVHGLACPFCAYGLEKKLKKVPGVSSYEVDLGGAAASVHMEKNAVLDFTAFEDAVKKAGFTLSGISVKAIGNISDSDTGLVFEVADSDQRFLFFEDESIHKKSDAGEPLETLTDQMKQKLLRIKEKGALVRVEGAVHEHAGLPAGLAIEKIEELP